MTIEDTTRGGSQVPASDGDRDGDRDGFATVEVMDLPRLLTPAAGIPRPGSGVPDPSRTSRVPSAMRPLRIALVGEGAYPFRPGGVSLWCHQLVEGMPEHNFTAVGLTIDGTEKQTWAQVDNLVRVVNIPLWGPAPPRGKRRRRPSSAFRAAHEAFLRVLVAPPTRRHVSDLDADELAEFEGALKGFCDEARNGDLAKALTCDDSLDRMLRFWHSAIPDDPVVAGFGQPSLQDAIHGTDLIEHMLRPLAHPVVEVDLYHLSMSGLSALVALRGKWERGTPIVLSEHGMYLRERYLALGQEVVSPRVKVLVIRFHRMLNRLAYARADVLAPHSTFNRRWQLRGGGAPERMRTMYNGISPDDFPEAQSEPDVPTIVFVGRIDRLKDLHTLIRAFKIVRDELPEARLRIFGPVTPDNEEYHRTCLALIDSLGLAGSAAFEGRIPRTVDAYEAGHVVALTSISEGFPFTVVEAMSVGRPPVCTDVGGVCEAVGDAGIVVPPRDVEAVARGCLRLLTDDAVRRELGQRARQRVLERFTLQQWTDAYRDIYVDLADGRRTAAEPAADVRTDRPGEAEQVIDLRDGAGGAADRVIDLTVVETGDDARGDGRPGPDDPDGHGTKEVAG
jgi:glycosyltransferase involved in cell wall biosynthesis